MMINAVVVVRMITVIVITEDYMHVSNSSNVLTGHYAPFFIP